MSEGEVIVRKPRLLDLFCCEGGAARGYVLAGFDVTGVDVEPRVERRYLLSGASAFFAGDANGWPLDGFDAVHASPPCQDHSDTKHFAGPRHGTGWMLRHTIERLTAWGGAWIVENVEGARAEMPGALTLCGSEFGLGAEGRVLKRHRLFLSNVPLIGAGGCCCKGKLIGGVYGHGAQRGPRGYGYAKAEAAEAMGMDWTTRAGLSQAIPPAYTEFLGGQLMQYLRAHAALASS